MVRPLLRTEITQVVNRQSWYDASKLTTDVLSLYKVLFSAPDSLDTLPLTTHLCVYDYCYV